MLAAVLRRPLRTSPRGSMHCASCAAHSGPGGTPRMLGPALWLDLTVATACSIAARHRRVGFQLPVKRDLLPPSGNAAAAVLAATAHRPLERRGSRRSRRRSSADRWQDPAPRADPAAAGHRAGCPQALLQKPGSCSKFARSGPASCRGGGLRIGGACSAVYCGRW